MAKPPQQVPWKSEQVVSTPLDFLTKVKLRLGIEDFAADLAASPDNTVSKFYITEEEDSLSADIRWKGPYPGWCWLNPPYSNLKDWTQKAVHERAKGSQFVMLVPSSTGSNWWKEYVEGKAYITFLNGRITFVGHDKPYPKDLALLLYAPFLEGGSCIWRWR